MTKTRGWIAALAVLAGTPALADWRALPGPEIAAVLLANDVVYEDVGWERHLDGGRLLLRVNEGPYGRTSVGEWRITGDARCLRWNRAMAWECYRVDREGADAIRFTDDWQNVTTGRLVPREGP